MTTAIDSYLGQDAENEELKNRAHLRVDVLHSFRVRACLTRGVRIVRCGEGKLLQAEADTVGAALEALNDLVRRKVYGEE